MASTIRTGAVTSILAVIILIWLLIDKQSNGEPMREYLALLKSDWSLVIVIPAGPPGFTFCLGRVYALTMLYNLNNRRTLKSGSASNGDGRNTTNIMNGLCEYLLGALRRSNCHSSQICLILWLPLISNHRWDSASYNLFPLPNPKLMLAYRPLVWRTRAHWISRTARRRTLACFLCRGRFYLDHEPGPFNALTDVTGQRIIFMPGHGGHTIEILLPSTTRATQLPHLPILCTLGNTSFSTVSRKRKDFPSPTAASFGQRILFIPAATRNTCTRAGEA